MTNKDKIMALDNKSLAELFIKYKEGYSDYEGDWDFPDTYESSVLPDVFFYDENDAIEETVKWLKSKIR